MRHNKSIEEIFGVPTNRQAIPRHEKQRMLDAINAERVAEAEAEEAARWEEELERKGLR